MCRGLIARNGGEDQYLYMQVTRGGEFGRNHAWGPGLKPTLFAFASKLEQISPILLEQGVSAVTAADTRWARRDIKSTALLANILLKQLSADAGAYETIMLERGNLPRDPRPRFTSSRKERSTRRPTASGFFPARRAMSSANSPRA